MAIVDVIRSKDQLEMLYRAIDTGNMSNAIIVGVSDNCGFCTKYATEILKYVEYPVFIIDMKHDGKSLLYLYKEEFNAVPFTIFHKNTTKNYWFQKGLMSKQDLVNVFRNF
jgi:hypothetical protein